MVARYPRAHLDTASKNKPITITSTLFDYLPNAVALVSVGGLVHKLISTDSSANTAIIDPSAFISNLLTNIKDFMSLGVEHIFTGPDHICFILALMLVAPKLKSLIKTLTGFTVAHSLTLILLTLGVVHVNPKIVDCLVALSIVYVGAENLFLKNPDKRFWVASGFGLVHGMAFAGNLKDAGLPDGSALFWSLLSFNLGVEAAQVIICIVCFPLLMKWKASTEKTGREFIMESDYQYHLVRRHYRRDVLADSAGLRRGGMTADTSKTPGRYPQGDALFFAFSPVGGAFGSDSGGADDELGGDYHAARLERRSLNQRQ